MPARASTAPADDLDGSLASGYVLREAPRSLSQTLPQRRGRFSTWPLIGGERGIELVEAATDEVFAAVGLDDYVGCSTFEYRRRPLLSIKPPASSERLVDICRKWFPLLMRRIKLTTKLPVVTLDNRSKIGSPIRKRLDNKLQAILPFIEQFLQGDFSAIEHDGFALQGIRTQWEKKSKVRTIVCATKALRAEYDEVTLEKRTDTHGRVCSRTRSVVNPALLNLAKLPVDNMIHHVMLSWRCCKPDLKLAREKGFTADVLIAPDWKNFDHQAGYMAHMYAAEVGGEYEKACRLLWSQDVLCRVDGWRDVVFMRAAEGFLQQFWSGDSSVAPFGKMVCLSVNAEFISSYFRLSDEATLDALIYGEHRDFGFRNYGDDNIVFGSRSVTDAYVRFTTAFLDLDFEDPPRFLGDVFTKHEGVWKSNLDWRSYFLNWYLAERPPGTLFRPYPCYGWVARRQDYKLAGPKNMVSLMELEDKILASHGLLVSAIIEKAAIEAREIADAAVSYRIRYDKAYLLTEEEKAKLPEYNAMSPALVRRLIDYFLPRNGGWNV